MNFFVTMQWALPIFLGALGAFCHWGPNLLEGREPNAAENILSLVSFLAAIFLFFVIRKLRIRSKISDLVLPKTSDLRRDASVTIPLPHLWEKRKSLLRLDYVLHGIFGVLIFVVVWYVLHAVWSNLMMALLGAAFVLPALGLAAIRNKVDSKALALSDGKVLAIKIDSESITIPTLLLTNPAYWKSVKAGLDHISVPWSDIIDFEICQDARNISQYLISLRGESPRFGIIREYVRDKEPEILLNIQNHLQIPICFLEAFRLGL